MTVPEIASAWMEAMAADDTHGYDQGSRWGPDYDCSSLVISAYKKAGVPLTCTYTGNMKADMLTHGFKDVTKKITLSTGKGLQRGDVLLHETKHTAMFIGGGRLVHAAGNEYGKATGGRTGDQTGKEICVTGYFNFPWQCVLRYKGEDSSAADPDPAPGGDYIVQPGDTLWGISQALGVDMVELARINGISNVNLIFPGQVLKLPGAVSDSVQPEDPKPAGTVSVELPVLRKGDTGGAVKALQSLLLNAGIDVGPCGVDGDFGEDTWVAVCDLQRASGTSVTGEVTGPEWAALITPRG